MRRILPGLLLLCILLSSCSVSPNPYQLSAQRIQADTEYLCNEIGDRPTGTIQERTACDWLEEQMKEIGFAQQPGL